MSAPERREPQSEAALDSRPPSLRSHLSSLFFIPLRARSPPHTVPESSSPYQPHRHPPPPREDGRSLSLSLCRSGPTIRPQPQPLPLPPALSPSAVSVESHPRQPLDCHLPSFAFLHRRYPLVLHLSLSLFLSRTTSTYHFYALAVWMHHRANSYAKLPMVRYLPTYLPSYLPSWLATYSRKTRWGCKLRITVDTN